MNQTLRHLERLISFDTRMSRELVFEGAEVFDYIKGELQGFELSFVGESGSALGLYVRRGIRPHVLFCAHLNTVHPDENWTIDPFELIMRDGLAIGLGVSDCKGGVAALLTALQESEGDVAALFTLDVNPHTKLSVKHFIDSNLLALDDFSFVFAVEPTRAAAVLEHRGLVLCTGYFNGVAGHAAQSRTLVDSAVHEAVRWSQRALDYANEQQRHMSYEALQGICFNLGKFEGGQSPNTIADHAVVKWGVRPLPNQDPMLVGKQLCELASRPWRVRWEYSFVAPTLPATAHGRPGSLRVARTRQELTRRSIFVGPPLDIWTSAALFSERGYHAAALGPGHMIQSNTPDEWARLNEIEQSMLTYVSLINEP